MLKLSHGEGFSQEWNKEYFQDLKYVKSRTRKNFIYFEENR